MPTFDKCRSRGIRSGSFLARSRAEFTGGKKVLFHAFQGLRGSVGHLAS